MRVVGGKFSDARIELFHIEHVKTGIDLSNLFLRGVGGFLFDDAQHLGALRALAKDAAVSCRILQLRGQQRHCRPLFQVKVSQPADRFC